MGNEFNIKLSNAKINSLFHNIRKLNGGKNLLAKKLHITTVTLDEYLKLGQGYVEKFENELSEIFDFDIDSLDEQLEETKSDYIEEFLQKENISGGISDRNRNAFIVYFYDKKEKIKEKEVFEYQKNIIDKIMFSDNENENFKIRILILFKLIYDRAQMSIDEELLYLKNKYGKTSSKNVNIVVTDLERRNKEDFGEVKEIAQPQQTLIGTINNFTQISVEQDKALGLLEGDKNGFIDVIPEKE